MKNALTAVAIIVLMMSVAPFVVAQESNHSFNAPITRVDNTVLLPEEIAGFDIKVDGTILKSSEMVPPTTEKYSISGTARKFTVAVLPGKHAINIITVDTEGRRSTDGVDIMVSAEAPPSEITEVDSVKVTVTVEVPI